MSTADLLRGRGLVVDEVGDAHEALAALELQAYDVLVSDIRMPGNDDLNVVKEIPPLNAGLPVILVTGYPSVPTALQALSLPVLAYMVKPPNLDELVGHIQRGVGYRRIQRMIHDSTDQLEGWVQDMRTLERNLQASTGGFAELSMHHLLGMMVGRIGSSLIGMKELILQVAGLSEASNYCHRDTCASYLNYRAALVDAIQTLEATKAHFKSKELQDLRIRLEKLVGK